MMSANAKIDKEIFLKVVGTIMMLDDYTLTCQSMDTPPFELTFSFFYHILCKVNLSFTLNNQT